MLTRLPCTLLFIGVAAHAVVFEFEVIQEIDRPRSTCRDNVWNMDKNES